MEPGKELETAKMHRVSSDKFIVNITFAWEHAVAVTDKNDEGKIVSHRFPQFSLNDCLKPAFFKYVILDNRFREHLVLSSPGGAGRNRVLKIDDMLRYTIAIPTVSEQINIAHFLTNFDTLITLQHRKLDQIKEYKKGLLQKMFPKEGETVPEVRFPGFTGEWERHKFGDIAKRQSDSMVSDDENPCVEFEDVIAEQGILNKDIYAKDVFKKGIRFTSEDVLYGKLRPYLHNWLNPDFAGVAVGDWWVLRPIKTDKDFLYRLIQTAPYDEAANQSSGTKMPRADWKLVSNTEFSIPASLDEQSKIADVFDSLDTLITLHQRKLDAMKEYKKGLLQQMFV